MSSREEERVVESDVGHVGCGQDTGDQKKETPFAEARENSHHVESDVAQLHVEQQLIVSNAGHVDLGCNSSHAGYVEAPSCAAEVYVGCGQHPHDYKELTSFGAEIVNSKLGPLSLDHGEDKMQEVGRWPVRQGLCGLMDSENEDAQLHVENQLNMKHDGMGLEGVRREIELEGRVAQMPLENQSCESTSGHFTSGPVVEQDKGGCKPNKGVNDDAWVDIRVEAMDQLYKNGMGRKSIAVLGGK
ncbi:hypothetical protein VNO78_10177 [Psophocarpus tetragonolobus]|uniref:Uncharacterized protein n=1 Tax=Psophocarpus tetragonolobus TaxID=3891 RepID=A0AAN9SKU8_PSOTE